jgi:hypothetical protein
VHDQLEVVLGKAAEKLAEAREEFRGFAGTAPLFTLIRDAFEEGRNLRRRFPVIKELVQGNFECPGHFLQRLDAREGVAVLHPRDVTAEQAGALLDVTLRKAFCSRTARKRSEMTMMCLYITRDDSVDKSN